MVGSRDGFDGTSRDVFHQPRGEGINLARQLQWGIRVWYR